jgi:hypothetical protein
MGGKGHKGSSQVSILTSPSQDSLPKIQLNSRLLAIKLQLTQLYRSQPMLTYYAVPAGLMFVFVLMRFLRDSTTPKTHLNAWIFVFVTALVWPLALPFILWQLVKRTGQGTGQVLAKALGACEGAKPPWHSVGYRLMCLAEKVA